ncbi:MAG: hypothetical protein ACFCU5_10225 [Pleurocapsa sp.]
MKLKNLVGLCALTILIPTITIASETKVKTGNVEVSTYRDGSVYVNTGTTTAQLPNRHSSRYWNPFPYWRLPWQNNCRNSSYQKTTQVTQSGSRVVQSNVSTHSCR